ncbi:fibrinogen like 1B isoform X3 [Ictalurus furcatus]|uniref:fibrinogen like 1B isoform X3 n=1 Tax=Ictalurus furcatus TaxID=66913 RepID=UPI002350C17C|nr:fibrinogen like 1B isoform X3 [Ictalurus furcatus]
MMMCHLQTSRLLESTPLGERWEMTRISKALLWVFFFFFLFGNKDKIKPCDLLAKNQYFERVMGNLEPLPGSIGHKAGYTLDRVPIHHRARSHTTDNLEMPISLQRMSLEWERKLEYPEETPAATDCSELFDRLRPESGFYRIRPDTTLEPFLVYCDMEDGGGWTVVQKRCNGKVDFNRDWEEYKNGFGHFKSRKDEFWLGNDHIHSLLYRGEKVMKIDLMDWNGEKSYAMYDNFKVADEKDKYRLYFGVYSGRAGDALSGGSSMVEQWSASHSGMQFSTKKQDNDRYLQGNCAVENMGGWWYNRCHAANLNGKFYQGGKYTAKHDNGVVWSTWRGFWYSLRHTSMKVRPTAFMDSLGSGAEPNI